MLLYHIWKLDKFYQAPPLFSGNIKKIRELVGWLEGCISHRKFEFFDLNVTNQQVEALQSLCCASKTAICSVTQSCPRPGGTDLDEGTIGI